MKRVVSERTRVGQWARWACAVVAAALATAEGARAYELVKVVSGRTVEVTHEGRPMVIELAGVSVPQPPDGRVKGEYRGAEARDFVDYLLRNRPSFVKELDGAPGTAGATRAIVRVGEDGRDLAKLLLEAGLAVVERSTVRDQEHLLELRAVEREARRLQRGMHDGGYDAFVKSQGTLVDMGVGTLSGDKVAVFLVYVGETVDSGGGSAAVKTYRSPVSAIRDWGSSMGLPPDGSASGH